MPKEDNVEAMKKNGKGTDLSAGGVRVEGDFIGDVGNVIKLEITSGTKPDTITAFAEIKWQKKINGCDQFGLEFLAIKDEDREIIEHIIK
jgi:ribosomal protein S6E (S10)